MSPTQTYTTNDLPFASLYTIESMFNTALNQSKNKILKIIKNTKPQDILVTLLVDSERSAFKDCEVVYLLFPFGN